MEECSGRSRPAIYRGEFYATQGSDKKNEIAGGKKERRVCFFAQKRKGEKTPRSEKTMYK